MRAWLPIGLLLTGCGLGHQSALGFRARQAVLRGDAAIFSELMEEAARAKPQSPIDDPKLTVLTHFLDLAADPTFFAVLGPWLENGWISNDMTCAIRRAHYRAVRATDPVAAQASAQLCLDRAQAAAGTTDRLWEVERCLSEAPFLVAEDISAYLPLLHDAALPIVFRSAVLGGLARVDLMPLPSASAAQVRASAQIRAQRLDQILDAARGLEPQWIASATARGALELESVAVQQGWSYLDRWRSKDPDLTWSWVRVMKAKEPLDHLRGLGLWSRELEPATETSWWLCHRLAGERTDPVLGPLWEQEALALWLPGRATVLVAHASPCAGFRRLGPYPLEISAKAALTHQTAVPGYRRVLQILSRGPY